MPRNPSAFTPALPKMHSCLQGRYSLRMFSTESFRNMTRFPIITWHTSSCNWVAEKAGLAGCPGSAEALLCGGPGLENKQGSNCSANISQLCKSRDPAGSPRKAVGCKWLINESWVKQLQGEAAVVRDQQRQRSNERLMVSHTNTQAGEQVSGRTDSRSPQAGSGRVEWHCPVRRAQLPHKHWGPAPCAPGALKTQVFADRCTKPTWGLAAGKAQQPAGKALTTPKPLCLGPWTIPGL